MLNEKAFANATAIVMAVLYVDCALLAYIAPDLIFSLAKSWMHTVTLESVKTTFSPDLGSLLYGFITATVLTWVTTYITVALYNKLVKRYG